VKLVVHGFGVDRIVLERLNRTKAAVEYPGTGTYQSALEVFHQLHCLVSYESKFSPPHSPPAVISADSRDMCFPVSGTELRVPY